MPRRSTAQRSKRLDELTPEEILEVCGPSDAKLRAGKQSNDQMIERFRKIGKRIRIRRAMRTKEAR